jgi:catechol 2,3-dioxygenase-like lactoylglutathione lyase family enzyme
MNEPLFTKVLQVATVVPDLDAAVRTYWHEFGVGPWQIYEFNPSTVTDMTRDGEPAVSSWRLALATIGDVFIELIQPLDDTSDYADLLRSRGGGLHHVGLQVRDYGDALEELEQKGHRVVAGGSYNGVRYAYLSTGGDLGFVSEIFDWPEGHVQEPDAVYPPAGAS